MLMENVNPPSVGKNITYYRKKKNMSMDDLSKRSGVSKSMLSQIEQGKSNPTVVTVWKIARSLDVNIQKLLESSDDTPIEVIRKEDMPITLSEDKLCSINIKSPVHMTDNLELYHLIFKPHGINKSAAHFPDTEEFLTVLKGQLRVIVGEHSKVINTGDTARYRADETHDIENISDEESEAFLVVWFPNK